MYAKITKDKISDVRVEGTYAGRVIFANGDPAKAFPVRLLDDDREIYYYALADDDALESLFEWAMHDSGCTILQTKNKSGKWEDCIS